MSDPRLPAKVFYCLIGVLIVAPAWTTDAAEDAGLRRLAGCPSGAPRSAVRASLMDGGKRALFAGIGGVEPLFFVRLRGVLRETQIVDDKIMLAEVLGELGDGDPVRWAFSAGASALQQVPPPKLDADGRLQAPWLEVYREFYSAWAQYSCYAAGEAAVTIGLDGPAVPYRNPAIGAVVVQAVTHDVDYAAWLCHQLRSRAANEKYDRNAVMLVLEALHKKDPMSAQRFVMDFLVLEDAPWRLAAEELLVLEVSAGNEKKPWFAEIVKSVGEQAAGPVLEAVWRGRARIKPSETIGNLLAKEGSVPLRLELFSEWAERAPKDALAFLKDHRGTLSARLGFSMACKVLLELARENPIGAMEQLDSLLPPAAVTGELRGPILFARDRVLASAARAIGVESPGRATAVQARIIDIAVQTEVAFVLASLWAERDSVAARAWAESKDGATREAAMVGVLVADGSVGPADRMASLESIADLGWRTRGMYELLRGSSVDEDLWRAVLALREEGDLRAAAICGLAQACLGKRAKLLRGDGGVLDVRTEGASGSSISRPPGVPPDYSQK